MSAGATDKEEAILSTALSLFTSRGFHGTPTSLISKEAGVATGTLFFYFRTKEALIDTLYRTIKTEAAVALRDGLDGEPDVEARLRRVCRNYLGWGLAHPEKVRFMGQFAHSLVVSKTVRDEGLSLFAFVIELLGEGRRIGLISGDDDELVLHMIVGGLDGLLEVLMKTDEPTRRELLLDRGLGLLWNGMDGRPGRG